MILFIKLFFFFFICRLCVCVWVLAPPPCQCSGSADSCTACFLIVKNIEFVLEHFFSFHFKFSGAESWVCLFFLFIYFYSRSSQPPKKWPKIVHTPRVSCALNSRLDFYCAWTRNVISYLDLDLYVVCERALWMRCASIIHNGLTQLVKCSLGIFCVPYENFTHLRLLTIGVSLFCIYAKCIYKTSLSCEPHRINGAVGAAIRI